DLSIAEFHDADGVRRQAVIAEHEFGDPEIAVADDPLDGEALLARLHRSALLDVASAANAFARLRIVGHRILARDLMLAHNIICIGGSPVPLDRIPSPPIVHLISHAARRGITLLPTSPFLVALGLISE